MREVFLDRADWVLSGSLEGWGDSIIPLFDLVVFISAPNEVRLQRLRAAARDERGGSYIRGNGVTLVRPALQQLLTAALGKSRLCLRRTQTGSHGTKIS